MIMNENDTSKKVLPRDRYLKTAVRVFSRYLLRCSMLHRGNKSKTCQALPAFSALHSSALRTTPCLMSWSCRARAAAIPSSSS